MNTAAIGRAPLGNLDRFYIGGKWVAPTTNAMVSVIEAATEKEYFRIAEAREADMNRAIAAAKDAFDNGPWPRMSHSERAVYLRALSAELAKRAGDAAQIWSRESGVLFQISSYSMDGIPSVFDYYAGLADTFAWREPASTSLTSGSGFAEIVREPVGVVGAIIPWNAPMSLLAYKLAPALIAGCTVILKSSPEAPGSGHLIAEVADAIGLPEGVVNVVTADREVSELLVRDARVDKISFTGSTAAGRRIGAICGERVARFSLELGGKSAAIVLNDADIEQVAAQLTFAECIMTGQICSSLTRIIVPRGRHDQLVEALAARFSEVKVGDPFDPESGMGPLATQRQREIVESYIAQGKAAGATLAAGGERPSDLDRGWYIQPTVFANVDNSSAIAREEIFGPVLSVIPVADEEEAVTVANDSIYGLNASIFTADVERANDIARRLRTGTVGHNGWRSDHNIGFGGFKQSGIGREGGVEGLRAYLENKTVILDEAPTSAKSSANGELG